MLPSVPTTLQSFHRFLEQQLQSEETAQQTPEQALARWQAQQATLQAIREGLADVEEGRTVARDEFDREFRKRRGLPDRT